MKKRYIIGALFAIAFLILALLSFETTDYADVPTAKKSGRQVQIICEWLKDRPYNYDREKNFFTFYAKDKSEKSDEIIKVEYNGPRPNNFDIAERVVIKGKYDGEAFQAVDILTKCPSRYESKIEELKMNQDSVKY